MRTIFHEGFKIFFYALNTAKEWVYKQNFSQRNKKSLCVYISCILWEKHYFNVNAWLPLPTLVLKPFPSTIVASQPMGISTFSMSLL